MMAHWLGGTLVTAVLLLTACGAQVAGVDPSSMVQTPALPPVPNAALPTSSGLIIQDPSSAALAAGNAVTSDPFGQVKPPVFQTVAAPAVSAPNASDVQSGVLNQARQVGQ